MHGLEEWRVHRRDHARPSHFVADTDLEAIPGLEVERTATADGASPNLGTAQILKDGHVAPGSSRGGADVGDHGAMLRV